MTNEVKSESDADERRPSGQKKRWSDFSPEARAAMSILAVVEAILTTIALRDLARRPARQVRGWKPLWFLALWVQPLGAPLYLLAGRRTSA